MTKHAVILAGGKGRRLQPYTINFPKPLAPVADLPILEIVLRQLKHAGFGRFTFAVGHLAELLMAYFGDGSKWGVQIEYSREDKPLGTVAPLTLIDDLPDQFLVMNGDVLSTIDYGQLFNFHRDNEAELTIACHRKQVKIDLGVIEFDHRLEVTGYREKPTLHYDVSMGVYVFGRSVLDLVPKDDYTDLPTLVHRLIEQQRKVKVYLSDCEWLDIGRAEDYAEATERFTRMRERFLLDETPAPPASRETTATSRG
ncbi:MAG: sugar phosphate nucleotidyltransferase [Planctomycetota bacterium]